ncbi:MAG: LysM domain-containing protein [Phycisphaeraceae bacterium]
MMTKQMLVTGAVLGLVLLGTAGCEVDRGPRPELGTVPPPSGGETVAPAAADEDEYMYEDVAPVRIEDEAPAAGGSTYTVRQDDTLWSIAVREYGDGQRWQDIRDANPNVDANNLPVGTELTLPE